MHLAGIIDAIHLQLRAPHHLLLQVLPFSISKAVSAVNHLVVRNLWVTAVLPTTLSCLRTNMLLSLLKDTKRKSAEV